MRALSSQLLEIYKNKEIREMQDTALSPAGKYNILLTEMIDMVKSTKFGNKPLIYFITSDEEDAETKEEKQMRQCLQR